MNFQKLILSVFVVITASFHVGSGLFFDLSVEQVLVGHALLMVCMCILYFASVKSLTSLVLSIAVILCGSFVFEILAGMGVDYANNAGVQLMLLIIVSVIPSGIIYREFLGSGSAVLESKAS